MELMQANAQWAHRPDDERFVNLDEMQTALDLQRERSRATVVSSRAIRAVPDADHKGLQIVGPKGNGFAPSHFAFGQLSTLVSAPAAYLRTLPSPMAADCLNYGFQVTRDASDIGLLLYSNGSPIVRAATGPKYGRIWNADVTRALRNMFGDGITGRFRVPGEFGDLANPITKKSTTLYAGDRDMFVFLADEQNRIEMPNRRNGRTGTLARGFFIWNSEVGSSKLGICRFLFDFMCGNHIVWGAEDVQRFAIRHTASAPDKFVEQATPMLTEYANGSDKSIVQAIEDARQHRLDNVDAFLNQRFGARMVEQIKAAHIADEDRPIETRWDVVTGVTALAREIKWQDSKVALETEAGKLLTIDA